VMGVPRPGVAAERYIPDTSRARVELGLDELVAVEDALRRTAKWHVAKALSNGMPPAKSTVATASANV
jgi:hypothetical protein